jgi:microcystin-dependent protein
MPYNITLSNGTDLIAGGLLDNTTDSANSSLTLVGKNFKSYGLFLNQNFVRLMENFALSTAPAAPLPGQLWFNSTSKLLNVNVAATKGALNAVWKTLAGMTYSSSTPTNPFVGEQWYDSSVGQLKIFTGTDWRLIGPISALSAGNSGVIPDVIFDAPPSTSYLVLKFFIEGTLVAIWSDDGPFASDVSGFATIRKGLNVNTNIGHKLYGLAEVSENLSVNGASVAGNAFLRSDTSGSISGSLSLISDSGLSLGIASDFVANVVSGTVILKNQTNNQDFVLSLKTGGIQTPFFRGNFQTGIAEAYQNPTSSSPGLSYATKNYVDILSGSVTGVANFFGNLTPSANVFYSLGNTSNRWSNIFSESALIGNITAANTFATVSNVASIFLGADLIPTANVSSNIGSAGMRINTLHASVASLSGLLSVGTSANIGTNANVGQNLAVGGTISVSGVTTLGSNINVTGNIISASTTASSSTATGAFVLPGGAGIGGSLFVGGNLVATSGTATTNTTSGALVVQGGVGISGAIVAGGNIVASSGTSSTNNTSGALVVNGGVGISGSIYNGGIIVSGGNIVAISGIASTTTSTGALVVVGGVGISGAINTGANVNVGSNLLASGASISGNLIVASNIFASSANVSGNLNVGSNLAANSGNITGNLNVGGIITGITMPVGTSNTAVATTAFAQAVMPTGGVMMWAANVAPTGWLLCNGAAVSRTTFAGLFAIIGSTFGNGDGATTFNVPNYTNRLPVGAGGLYTIGTTGGSKDATLVSHTHTATGTFVTGVTRTFINVDGAVEATIANVLSNVSTTTGTATISTSGSSDTDANMPPYLTINFIIKT